MENNIWFFINREKCTCNSFAVCVGTCTAIAKPSDKRDDVNQTCRQVWNAAIWIEPNLEANEAAKVTQNVTATTLANSIPPVQIGNTKLSKLIDQMHIYYNIGLMFDYYLCRVRFEYWYRLQHAMFIALHHITFIPFLRNLENCKSLMLGGMRTTFVSNINKRTNAIMYLKAVHQIFKLVFLTKMFEVTL